MATSGCYDASASEIECLLTCPICLERLKDPRTLGCLHSFCERCLQKAVVGQRDKAAEMAIDEFNCPECKTEFILRPGQLPHVRDIVPNIFISNMLEVYETARRQNKKVEDEDENRGPSLCKKHKDTKINGYCATCKELICLNCMLYDGHANAGHLCIEAAKMAEKLRDSIRYSSRSLEKELEKGSNALQEIEKVVQALEENKTEAKHEIRQQKQEILEAITQNLEEQTNNLMKELDSKCNETNALLAKQKSNITTYMNKVKGSLDLAKNLVKKGNGEEILSVQPMVKESVEKLKNHDERPPRTITPVHDGHIEYKPKPATDIASIVNTIGEVACHSATIPHDLGKISTILNGHYKCREQVKDWVGDDFQWRLCYRASKDGWSAKDFHTSCDDKGPTLTLVQVGHNIFGGFSDQSWEGKGYQTSSSSFLFSLKNSDNLDPFKASVYQNERRAVYRYPSYGPTFGGGYDLHICDKPNIYCKSYANLGRTYQPPEGYAPKTRQTKSLLAGSAKFTPTQIEVFY